MAKKKYSITTDILSFQRCRRQYGYFVVKGYQPSYNVQIWHGIIIHQVLDKLHMHYGGLITPETKGQIPSDEDVERYFKQIENNLKARGICAINSKMEEHTLDILKKFNKIEGHELYPNIENTECKLQSDFDDYIMHGVVDVLKTIPDGRKNKEYDLIEIWDYKGSEFPDIGTKEGRRILKDYQFQMLVYAQLYYQKTGKYPLKGVLYFLGELKNWNSNTRPPQAVYMIDYRDPENRDKIKNAVDSFTEIVKEIEKCKRENKWDQPKNQTPDKKTCDICDLRWDCPLVDYSMRYP